MASTLGIIRSPLLARWRSWLIACHVGALTVPGWQEEEEEGEEEEEAHDDTGKCRELPLVRRDPAAPVNLLSTGSSRRTTFTPT